MTQEELAARSGISVRAISDLERDRTHRPYPRNIRILVTALGLPYSLGDDLVALTRRAHHARAGRQVPPGLARSQGESPAPGTPGKAGDHPDRSRRPLVPVPQQLPPATRYFVGRRAELTSLTTQLGQPAEVAGTVAITMIGGASGVGKTAFAVHWAHEVAGQFPDGQLYVNLRGAESSGKPVAPGEAICGFLEALQVPAASIPTRPEAQVGLYRSLLANRRILIILDDAGNAGQVYPLLPASPACMVVVNGSTCLTDLVATHGAQVIALRALTEAESRELLCHHLGPGRVAAEPKAVAELLRLCAGIPQALSLVAARASITPSRRLAVLAAELKNDHRWLEILEAG